MCVPMDKEEPFKVRLRRWRGDRTQDQAAKILGVSVRTYGPWEVGDHTPTTKPSIREIEAKMAEVGMVKEVEE